MTTYRILIFLLVLGSNLFIFMAPVFTKSYVVACMIAIFATVTFFSERTTRAATQLRRLYRGEFHEVVREIEQSKIAAEGQKEEGRKGQI